MNRFSVGDRVFVRKPNSPHDGQVCEVDEVYPFPPGGYILSGRRGGRVLPFSAEEDEVSPASMWQRASRWISKRTRRYQD